MDHKLSKIESELTLQPFHKAVAAVPLPEEIGESQRPGRLDLSDNERCESGASVKANYRDWGAADKKQRFADRE